MRGLLFRLIPVCLFLVAPVVGQTVNEKASTAWIEGDKAVVRLSIAGDDGGRATDARVELLDVNGKVAALQTRSALRIRSGEQQIEFSFPLGRLREIANSELPWYRLRYRLGDANGIISLSQMLRGLFELRISASNSVLAGVAYRVRVRATSPVDRQPVSGVRVDTNIILDLKGEDESNLKLAASGETDVDGFAVLDFAIPVDARLDGDGKIKVTGRKSGLLRTAEEDLSTLGEDVQVLSLADKPIYQPGQVLNLRGIVLKGAEAKTVLGGADVEFRVTDDDDTLLYRETVNASEYGIAAMSWRIPSNAKLGDYRIEIRDSDGQQIGWHKVKVSRYDLPNFVVTAKPSKPFYLPDDKEAEIEVRADYLFGKPVTKGKVRVVEENRREWNWKEQKYDIDEGAVREGEIDAEGKFVARFDLSETHKELKDDRWDKYDDIKFAAYFTDVTTNRTEQRRFDIRVSREPIHVYLIRGDNHGNSRLPMNTYVSAFYADGTPAECDVEIRASLEDEDKFKTVGRIRTNSFGAGKISMPRPKIGDPDDNLDFRILVKDASGRRGTSEDTVYFDDDD
ncbi:MAG TPA: MG2 domain-containing protein, partial [Pyrinomonadaceae bacterium]